MVFPQPKTLAESLVWTVAYTDVFAYPLTAREIWQRLVGFAADEKMVTKQLVALVRRGKLCSVERAGETWCFLPGRQKIVGVRLARQKIADKKWVEVRHAVALLRRIPWVQSIWVTGSLAMANATAEQDIDFMVVTAAHRLWLTRLLVTLVAMGRGRKRRPQGAEPRTWCFNLWLDEDHLTMPAEKRSVYVAYEVVQAVPVYERALGDAQKFWSANVWIKKFLPNSEVGGVGEISFEKNVRSGVLAQRSELLQTCGVYEFSCRSSDCFFKRDLPNSLLLNLLEKLSFALQWRYMQKHMTTESVGPGFAFFHPRQTAQQVLSAVQARLKSKS